MSRNIFVSPSLCPQFPEVICLKWNSLRTVLRGTACECIGPRNRSFLLGGASATGDAAVLFRLARRFQTPALFSCSLGVTELGLGNAKVFFGSQNGECGTLQ